METTTTIMETTTTVMETTTTVMKTTPNIHAKHTSKQTKKSTH